VGKAIVFTRALIGIGLSATLVACGGGGGGSSSPASPIAGGGSGSGGGTSTDACGVAAQIEFVETVATSYYYWYDELADVSASDYSSASDYLAAIMRPVWCDAVDAPGDCQSTGRDPGFSYMTTIEEDTQRFTSGAFYGYGVRYRIIDNNFYFADSYEGGPAYNAGIRRGQRLLAVDRGQGFETWEALVARNAELPEAVFGPRGELQTTTFRVEYDEVVSEFSVTTAETSTPPIAGEPTLISRASGAPVGYLNFRTFIDAAEQPLRDAAETFANAGVTDLVIDLRYNGGGLVRVAETLLNLLAGDTANGELSYIINLNDKHQNENSTADFRSLNETFSPLRIAFITTGGSASASELIINGLDPHIEVVLVGSETSGKAVGQSAFDLDPDACETRFRLIAFEIQNGEGQGGYYTGLASTGRFTLYDAIDDATRPFGDAQEASLQTALAWLNGTLEKDPSEPVKRPRAPLGVAAFEASWGVTEQPPLNPDGSVRSF
jgi:C-terminal processing protease CtpA/Prc